MNGPFDYAGTLPQAQGLPDVPAPGLVDAVRRSLVVRPLLSPDVRRSRGISTGTTAASIATATPISDEEPGPHPRGRPSTRSATMLRWISDVPPEMVPENERRYCRAQAPS